MKEQKKGKCKIPNSKSSIQSSGVTLIALIITIIILLILAVISVVLVMRWNMINKTEYAAEGYQGASERDILEVAFGEYAMDKAAGNESADLKVSDENGEEGTTVAEVVEKENTAGEQTGWKVTFSSGNEYTVDKDGMIRRISTGPLGDAVDEGDYGKQVNFKSEGEGLGDLIWRIFYKDEKNVYLISEKPNKEYPISHLDLSAYTTKYSSGADVSRQGQDLMQLAKQDGSVFSAENTNVNIKGTAYLCDTTKWEDYLDADGKAAWVMGGPTMELFVKSYDATQKKEPKAETNLQISNKGYTNPSLDAKDTFNTQMSKGIYMLKNEDTYWWLASPSSLDQYRMRFVGYNVSGLGSYTIGTSGPSGRPVVCIPIENFTGFTVANQTNQ